jgi:SAM-dependent methyltransferase
MSLALNMPASFLGSDARLVADYGEEGHYLDWTQRPPELQKKIDEVFTSLKSRPLSHGWGFAGVDPLYDFRFGGKNEHEMILSMVQQTNDGVFKILDIGGARGGWARALAEFLNQFPLPVPVCIISLSAEGRDSIEAIGNCAVCQFSGVKSEQLELESGRLERLFKDKQVPFGECKFNAIVSRRCFRHFADPLGSWLQAYNLLQKGGIFLFDNFLFKQNQETNTVSMKDFIPSMDVPYMVQKSSENGDDFNPLFLTQKMEDGPYRLRTMTYKGVVEEEVPSQHSKMQTLFTYTPSVKRSLPDRVSLPFLKESEWANYALLVGVAALVVIWAAFRSN